MLLTGKVFSLSMGWLGGPVVGLSDIWVGKGVLLPVGPWPVNGLVFAEKNCSLLKRFDIVVHQIIVPAKGSRALEKPTKSGLRFRWRETSMEELYELLRVVDAGCVRYVSLFRLSDSCVIVDNGRVDGLSRGDL